jgi:hypothetical protein
MWTGESLAATIFVADRTISGSTFFTGENLSSALTWT